MEEHAEAQQDLMGQDAEPKKKKLQINFKKPKLNFKKPDLKKLVQTKGKKEKE